jgi:hypothetical protein
VSSFKGKVKHLDWVAEEKSGEGTSKGGQSGDTYQLSDFWVEIEGFFRIEYFDL